jgi:hypothetical protein
MAYTYDQSTTKLYLNGANVAFSATGPLVIPNTTNSVVLGRQSTSTYFWGGKLANFRMWSYPLTADEILTVMNRKSIGFEPGLVAYWKLNEGSGPIALSCAPVQIIGSISNATYVLDAPATNYVLDVRTDWFADDHINAADFNRIEGNIRVVKEYLRYIQINIATQTTITLRDKIYVDLITSINRIEDNLDALRAGFLTPPNYLAKKTWVVGMGFNHEDVIRLESNILTLMQYAFFVYRSLRYCGDFTCGDYGRLY